MNTRYGHTATLLPDGKILVTGGQGDDGRVTATAELYDAATGTWTPTGSLNQARTEHAAILLPDGKVLVAAGAGPPGYIYQNSAELYDPATGTWTFTGSLKLGSIRSAAVLLPNGRVLVVYQDFDHDSPRAECYDPATGSWSDTGTPISASYGSRMTLLPNSKVLKAGGADCCPIAAAELYDPASGSWTTTGSLNEARFLFTMTLLPNGQVLAASGFAEIASTELYDPASGSWTLTGSLETARYSHSATLLFDGTLLVTGGYQYPSIGLDSTELYDTGLGYKRAWRPKIRNLAFTGGKRLRLEGSGFQGISQASGGNTQDSSTNYPLVQLRSMDSSEVVFLQPSPGRRWSHTRFISLPVTGFPFGPALVTVFTNGIPSEAKSLIVTKRDR